MNVIANDGTYVAPRLVLGTVGADGEITDAEPSATHPVVSAETAAQMQSMLRDVVCDAHGTADEAQVEGLSVAGKTGTAYKALDRRHVHARGRQARVLLELRRVLPGRGSAGDGAGVDRRAAAGITSGGQSAAPLFREIVPTIIHELGIEPPPGSTDCDGDVMIGRRRSTS